MSEVNIRRRIGLTHETQHLCTRLRMDGIKAISQGIKRGKQVIKFANKSNRDRLLLPWQRDVRTSPLYCINLVQH